MINRAILGYVLSLHAGWNRSSLPSAEGQWCHPMWLCMVVGTSFPSIIRWKKLKIARLLPRANQPLCGTFKCEIEEQHCVFSVFVSSSASGLRTTRDLNSQNTYLFCLGRENTVQRKGNQKKTLKINSFFIQLALTQCRKREKNIKSANIWMSFTERSSIVLKGQMIMVIEHCANNVIIRTV